VFSLEDPQGESPRGCTQGRYPWNNNLCRREPTKGKMRRARFPHVVLSEEGVAPFLDVGTVLQPSLSPISSLTEILGGKGTSRVTVVTRIYYKKGEPLQRRYVKQGSYLVVTTPKKVLWPSVRSKEEKGTPCDKEEGGTISTSLREAVISDKAYSVRARGGRKWRGPPLGRQLEKRCLLGGPARYK